MQRIKVWDLPVRLFHWSIVALIAAAWVTQEVNMMDWHVWCGYAILTLLLFRLIWGFVGSDTSRFSAFLRSPMAAVRHLSHFTQRGPDNEIGHNAAGGWMVLVLLAQPARSVQTAGCALVSPWSEPAGKRAGRSR